jgi:hypothetical protein
VNVAKLAAAALALAILELALGWRVSLSGAAPDVLFVLAALAATDPRPAGGVPAACAIGLLSDFLLGGRLGLMALGYGLGARAIQQLEALLGRSAPGARGGLLARAGWIFLFTLAGAAAAHGTVALLGVLFGGWASMGGRLARAVGIAFLTAAAAPFLWPVLTVWLGGFSATPRGRGRVLEA